MIIAIDSFNNHPQLNKQKILTQIEYIYKHSFGISSYEPNADLQLVIDLTDGVVRGLLNVYHKGKHVSEIYNVCTHPDHRRKGVMKGLFASLPPKFYYIQASFANRIAYNAYSRYFTEFRGIGRLTYGGEVSFVFGGMPMIETSRSHEDICDRISQLVTTIDSIDLYTRHFYEYADVYEFVIQNYDLVHRILHSANSHIRLSREVMYVWKFAGDMLENCIELFQLVHNSYTHGISIV